MTQIAVWFERKFSFGYPKELLPNLMARLRGTPARLEEALRCHTPQRLIARPEHGWSAQENAGHLLQLEPLWLTRVDDFVRGSNTLTPTDLANRATTDGGYNERPLEEILSAFRAARSRLLSHVASLEEEAWERGIVHPRLKQPMTLTDHLFFVAEHDDHHLARIWELFEGL